MKNDSIKILIAGDFAADDVTFKIVRDGSVSKFWGDISEILYDKDYSILNLESPLTCTKKTIKKIGSSQKAHPENAKLISQGMFNAVCMANNHILDYGMTGLIDTISCCNNNGLKMVGAGIDSEFKKPLEVKIKDKRLLFFNFCENEFSSAKLYGFGANPLNIIDNFKQIKTAKSNSDYVIVILHGGREYHHLPLPGFKQVCEFFIDIGADCVVGHHPHYYSGFSYYNNKPIFYSLGNLYANSRRKDANSEKSYLLLLQFDNEKISHEIIGIKKHHDQVVRRMNKNEQMELEGHIKDLNRIINDAAQLEEYWNQQEKEFSTYWRLLNCKSPLIYKLAKRLPFIPIGFSRTYSLRMQNLVQCESHRELLLRTMMKRNKFSAQ